jgi:hypothetical protein
MLLIGSEGTLKMLQLKVYFLRQSLISSSKCFVILIGRLVWILEDQLLVIVLFLVTPLSFGSLRSS